MAKGRSRKGKDGIKPRSNQKKKARLKFGKEIQEGTHKNLKDTRTNSPFLFL